LIEKYNQQWEKDYDFFYKEPGTEDESFPLWDVISRMNKNNANEYKE
jgi:hypothetical protein